MEIESGDDKQCDAVGPSNERRGRNVVDLSDAWLDGSCGRAAERSRSLLVDAKVGGIGNDGDRRQVASI